MSVFNFLSEPIKLAIGTKSLNQLIRAESAQAAMGLADHDVFENWFAPFLSRSDSYIPLSDTKYRQARNHLWNDSLLVSDFDTDLCSYTEVFANPLSYPFQHRAFGTNRDGELWGPRAADRVTNGGLVLITAEADVRDPVEAAKLLRVQLEAMRGAKRREDALLMKFDKAMQRYADYRGCCAVYSGNKSIHFHFAFDTEHLTNGQAETRFGQDKWQGDITPDELEAFYKERAGHLLNDLRSFLGLTVAFDTSLISWHQFRRMPGGSRVATAGNLLGIPVGTRVPQLVLMDLSRGRAPNGATSYLFDARKCPAPEPRKPHSARGVTIDIHNEEEVIIRLQNLCEIEWGQEYPKPVQIRYIGDEVAVYFANSPGDHTPSSVMRGTWHGLALAGSHDFDRAFALPEVLAHYLFEFTTQADALPLVIDMEALSPYERRFFEARDSVECREAFASIVPEVLAGDERLVLIQAPEGLGKTTSLMSAISAQMQEERKPQPLTLARMKAQTGFRVFSCPSYVQQNEKVGAIKSAGMHAVLIRSATDLHKEAALALGEECIDIEDAAIQGEAGWWAAVRSRQPRVVERMREMIIQEWGDKPFDRSQTMLVTVHATAERWETAGPTRAIWHPEWLNAISHDDEQQLRGEMGMSLLIMDEVDQSNFMLMMTDEKYLVGSACGKALKSMFNVLVNDATLSQKREAWEKAINDHEDRTAAEGYKLNDFIEFIEARYNESNIVQISTKRHLFGKNNSDKDIYQKMNGTLYLVKDKAWMFHSPARIIFLTTECIPAAIARSLKKGNEAVSVHNLTRSPGIPRAVIPVEQDKLVSKDRDDEERLTKLVAEKKALNPDALVISNLARKAITHSSARGSNEFAGRDILSFYTMMGPQQYGQLLAVGQYCGIADTISLYYLDQFNQTIGRNKGYRDEGASHKAFFHPSVYRYMANAGAFAGNRYQPKLTKTVKRTEERMAA